MPHYASSVGSTMHIALLDVDTQMNTTEDSGDNDHAQVRMDNLSVKLNQDIVTANLGAAEVKVISCISSNITLPFADKRILKPREMCLFPLVNCMQFHQHFCLVSSKTSISLSVLCPSGHGIVTWLLVACFSAKTPSALQI